MKATILFMALVVGSISSVLFVLADTEDKKEVFKGISLACFAGAFFGLIVL